VRNVHSVAVASAETEMVALRPVTIAFVTGIIGCFQATCRYQKRNNCESMTLADGNVVRLHMCVPFIKSFLSHANKHDQLGFKKYAE